MDAAPDILDRAADALLALAAETPWREVTLRTIAERAGLTLAKLYARANSKAALLAHISERFDLAALAAAGSDAGEAHDRLFDATMARIEAMAPHREALIAIARADGPVVMLPHFPRTARSILEAAGVEATAPRLIAMTAVWARTVQVWRDDEGALNRTMAEIDRLLKDMRRRLARIGAGF
jgi:AcrR family transcriptional regulator